MSNFNLKLKVALLEAGMRQRDLAEALGVVDSVISEYIHNRKSIPQTRAEQIGALLKKDLADLGLAG
jgi:plasmid maintenance system antidote protein VapI